MLFFFYANMTLIARRMDVIICHDSWFVSRGTDSENFPNFVSLVCFSVMKRNESERSWQVIQNGIKNIFC